MAGGRLSELGREGGEEEKRKRWRCRRVNDYIHGLRADEVDKGMASCYQDSLQCETWNHVEKEERVFVMR